MLQNKLLVLLKKHNNSFLPTKGVFQMKSDNITQAKNNCIDSTSIQMRKQKRMRITSNKEKYAKKNMGKNHHCLSIKQIRNNNLNPVCYINKKITSTCGFCGSNKSGENISNCEKQSKYRKEFYESNR